VTIYGIVGKLFFVNLILRIFERKV